MKLNQLKILALGVLIGGSIIAGIAFRPGSDKEGSVIVENNRLLYKWYPTQVPKSLSFAGEQVPLNRWEVKERLDRELLVNYYMHGSTLYILKLAGRVFPTIERQLKANGLSDDFKYLCVAESSLQNPTSPAGAVGYWQFMKETGLRYGLEITDEVDERYHLEKSTNAACRYLKEAYAKFGNWTAAAASYNCGMGGFSKHSSFQMSGNYYDLLLPEETNRYIFRILALKTILGNAEKYGYIVEGDDQYKPVATRKVTVSESIGNLAEFAQQQGSSYKMLKLLNPWLRDRKLTIKPGKTYVLELPAR
jgi:membrane-bound lytic murein transglycosylase D